MAAQIPGGGVGGESKDDLRHTLLHYRERGERARNRRDGKWSRVRERALLTGGGDGSDRVKIYVYPDERDLTDSPGRLLPFVNEGIDSSPRLVRTDVPEGDGTAWIVDLTKVKCSDLMDDVQETLGRRMADFRERYSPAQGGSPAAATRFTSDLLWPVFLIDFSDYGYVLDDNEFYNIDDLTAKCIRPLSDLVGSRNLYFATRQHMRGRHVSYKVGGANGDDDAVPIGNLGVPIDFKQMYFSNFMSGAVRQVHYGYRTMMRDALEAEADEIRRRREAAAPAAGGGDADGARAYPDPHDLASIPRDLDVAFFWMIGTGENRTGENRDRVRVVLLGMKDRGGYGDRIYADKFAKGMGSVFSQNVTQSLAREMMRYKIVVVAQRDHYEGHFHLMDGLLSGAMVLTDPMHSLPVGLEDGESVVVYRSPRDLREKIELYLGSKDSDAGDRRIDIGRKGREVALRLHSAASWVERIVLGNWSTTEGT